ncbi:MAG: flippase activity-associated protein Agl23 [Thermomicrobiales bacterium]
MVAPELSLESAPSAAPGPRETVARFGQMTRTLTIEQCAWLALFIGAVLTRFWDLGSRALHHDESLHAWFSYQYAIGKGYQHDPLMHGPFLFHLNALVYVLFGATDASSRYGPALFGVILVMLPILLRPLIGRWGALICAFLLLVSPSILYYSRLLRHDVYLMTFTFLVLVAIARYVQTQQGRWVFVGMIALAMAHANHEASYIIAVLLGAFLFIIITWRVAKSLLIATVVYLAAAGATLLVLPKVLKWEKLPKIPWDTQAPGGSEVTWAHWGPYLRTMLFHPMILSFLIVTVLYLCTAVYILGTLRLRETEPGTTPNDRLFGGGGMTTVVGAFHRLLAEKRVLFGAAGIAFFFWALLYSSLFTNVGGLFIGAFYSGIYWAGQQDVFRGGQPWYYFLFLFPLSGPIAFLFGIAAGGVTVGRFIAYVRGTRVMTIRLFTQVMLLWYGVGMLAVLSGAGEKMPWLVCHIILPFTILAASLLGEAVEYLTAAWRMPVRDRLPAFDPRPAGAFGIVATARPTRTASHVRVSRRLLDSSVIGGVILFLTGWFFAVSHISANPAGDIRLLLLAMPVILIAFFAAYAIQVGLKRALAVAAIAVAIPLALFEVHLGWHLAFFAGDVPTDMLVYTQTAPDMPMMMREINTLSKERTGGYGLPIWYSSATVWPMNWYLRDYVTTPSATDPTSMAAHFMGSSLTAPPPDDVAIIMVAQEDFSAAGGWEDQYLTNYERTDYAMRWWFPEEIYRSFTYSPLAPRPDYPGLWKPGIVPAHTDPTTGKVVAAAPGDVRPTWGDTLKKAWQSISALGNAPHTTQVDANGVQTVVPTTAPEPASNLWRFVALREPPHVFDPPYGFHLYVRKDLVREFNGIRY